MGSFPLSLVPFHFEGIQANCAWSPEPIFPLGEAAKLLGIRKGSLEVLRFRHLEVKIGPEALYNLYSTFGPSATEYGEVRLALESGGGPQEYVCLTHLGLFRHALFVRSKAAKNYVLTYPSFVRALCFGSLKGPRRIDPMYLPALLAPYGRKDREMLRLAGRLGIKRSCVYRRMARIRRGEIDSEGRPIVYKRGPRCFKPRELVK